MFKKCMHKMHIIHHLLIHREKCCYHVYSKTHPTKEVSIKKVNQIYQDYLNGLQEIPTHLKLTKGCELAFSGIGRHFNTEITIDAIDYLKIQLVGDYGLNVINILDTYCDQIQSETQLASFIQVFVVPLMSMWFNIRPIITTLINVISEKDFNQRLNLSRKGTDRASVIARSLHIASVCVIGSP